jgi:plastocyanin/uncharacterized membrane protein YozB (DUF420 family)
MNGFLGTGATFRADLNLVVQILMGVALLAGAYLARKRNFKAHKYCQSSVMVLNLLMIFLIMAPSFHRQVEPQIPGGLTEAYYSVAMVHAVLGTLAELLGLYVVLVAGTKVVPKKLRFKRFKPWMRAALALWWVVVLLGVATYYIWYVAPPSKDVDRPAAAAQTTAATERVTVNINNFQFEPKEVTIPAGSVVEWVDQTGRHTVEADDGSFKSEALAAGGRFEHKFDQPGVYPYFCGFHGDKGGVEMAGVVTVTPAQK